MFPLTFAIAVLTQNAPTPLDARIEGPQVRQTVEKSLAFLEKEGLDWETTKCVSCHHGPG